MAQSITTVLVGAGVGVGPGTQLPGEWVLEDVNRADIQGMGKLAVEQYGSRTLVFEGIINAESKKGTGRNYRLTIQATDSSIKCFYDAIAHVSAQGNQTVKSFIKLD